LINFFHKDCEKANQNIGVRLSCVNKSNKLLYVVDDKMYLSCYSLTDVFNELEKRELGK
jgi:hypothetical protein